MYKLICCNLSKSNRSLTNFTSTYRQVAQNYEKRHSKKKQFVSETDLHNVEEDAETSEAKADTIEEESSAETTTKSCSSLFTKKLGLRDNYHLTGMDKYSQNNGLATSTSSNYFYSSIANQDQHTTPKKKPFKNKAAMDMYKSALEQLMKIKIRKASFDKLYRKVKLAPQLLLKAASWEDESKAEEQQKPVQEPEEKKKTKKFVYVYPEERLKYVKKEPPPPSTRCRPHIMDETAYQLMRRKVKITYPTHLVKYKLGKLNKIVETKTKEEDEGSLFVRENEMVKSEYPVLQRSDNVKVVQHSHQDRQEEKTEEAEWQDVTIKHPVVENIDKLSKTRINKNQNKLSFRLKDYKDLLREGDALTAKEDATMKLPAERKKSRKVATDIEAEQTWSQPRIIVHPAVASKPLNMAEKYPKSYFVERNDNYDIENICVKNNENSTSSTKYGDYFVEFDRGARMAEKETKIMRKLKVILPDMQTKPQKPIKEVAVAPTEVAVAPTEVVGVNITETKTKEVSLKEKGPAESLADYLKKLKELKEQTAVDRLNIRKPVVSDMVKQYKPPSTKNPIPKLGVEENIKTEDRAGESKPDPPEKELYRLLEKPPQQNAVSANTETHTNEGKQNDGFKPEEINLESVKLAIEPSIEAPKEVTKPLERVDTETSKPPETSKPLVQIKKKLPTRPIYSSIPVAKNKQLLKKIKSEAKSDTSQLEIVKGAAKTNEIVTENKLNANNDDTNQAAQKKSMQNLKKIMNRYEVQQTKLQTEPGTLRKEIKLDSAAIKRINKRRRKNKLQQQQEKKEKEKAEAIREEPTNDFRYGEHEFGGKGLGGQEEQNKTKMEQERRMRMIANSPPAEKKLEQSVEKGKENVIRVEIGGQEEQNKTKMEQERRMRMIANSPPAEIKLEQSVEKGKENVIRVEIGGQEEQNKTKMEQERRMRMIANSPPAEKKLEQSVEKGKKNVIRVEIERFIHLSLPPDETKKKHVFKIGKEEQQEQQSSNIINSSSPGPEKKSHTFKLDRKEVLQSASTTINLMSGEEKQQQKEKADAVPPPTQDKHPPDEHDKKFDSISINKSLLAPSEDRIEKTVPQLLDQRDNKTDLSINKRDVMGKDQPSQIFKITSTTRNSNPKPTKHKNELPKYELEPNVSHVSRVKLLDKIIEETEVNEKQEQPSEISELEKSSIDNKLKEALTSILPLADETVKEEHRLDQRDGKQELEATKGENMEKDQAGIALEKLFTEKRKQDLLVEKELERNIVQEIVVKVREATQKSKKEETEQQSKTEIDKHEDTDENKELHIYRLAGQLLEAIKSEEKIPFKRIEFVEKVMEEDSSVKNPTTKIEQKKEDKRENYAKLKEAGWHITIEKATKDEVEPVSESDKRQGTNRPAIRREKPKETPKGKKKKKKPKTKKDMVLPSKGQNDPRIRNSSLDKQTEELKSSTETTNDKILLNSEAISVDSLTRVKSLTGLVDEQNEIMLNEINEKLSDAQKYTKLNTDKDPADTAAQRRYELMAIPTDKTKQVVASDVVQTAAKQRGEDEPAQLNKEKREDTKEQLGTVQELALNEKRRVEKEDEKTPSNPKDKQSIRVEKPECSLFAKIKDHTKRLSKDDKYTDIHASKEKSSPKSKNYLNSTAEELNSKSMVHSMNEKKTDEISISEGKPFTNINKRKYAKEYGENTKTFKPTKKTPKEKAKKSLTVTIKLSPTDISKPISETKMNPIEQTTRSTEQALNLKTFRSPKGADEIKAEESEEAIKSKSIEFSDNVFSARRGRTNKDLMKVEAKENEENEKDYTEKDTEYGENAKAFKPTKKVLKEKDKKPLTVTATLTPSTISRPIPELQKHPIEQTTRSTEQALKPKIFRLSKGADEIKAEESEAPIKSESIEFSDNVFAKLRRGKIDDDMNQNAEKTTFIGGEIKKLSSRIRSWLIDDKVAAKQKADDEQDYTENAPAINDEVEPKEENEIKATESGAALVKSESKEFSDNVFSKVRRGRFDDDLIKANAQENEENEKDYTVQKDTGRRRLIINDDDEKINVLQVKAKAKEMEMGQKGSIEKGGTVQSAMDQKGSIEKGGTVQSATDQKGSIEKGGTVQSATGQRQKLKDQKKSADETTLLGEVAKTRTWQVNTVETRHQKKPTEKNKIVQAAVTSDEKSDEKSVPRSRSKQGFKVQHIKDGKTMVVFPYIKKKLRSIIVGSATTTKEKPEKFVADEENRFNSKVGASAMGKYRDRLTPSDAENMESSEVQDAKPKKKTAIKVKSFSRDNEADNELKRSTSEDPKTMQKKQARKEDKHLFSPSSAKKGPADVKSENEADNELKRSTSEDPKTMQKKQARKENKHLFSPSSAKKVPAVVKSEKKIKPGDKKAASSKEFSFSNPQETKSHQFPGLIPNMRRNSADLKSKREKIPIGFVRVIDEDEKKMAKSVLSARPKIEKTLLTKLDNAKHLQKKKVEVNKDDNLECCRDLLKKNAAIIPSKSLPELNEIKWGEEKYAQAINLLLPISPESTANKGVQEQEKTDKKSKGGQELIHTSKPAATRKETLDLSKKIEARDDTEEPVLPDVLGKKRELIPPVKKAQQTEKADSQVGDIDCKLNSNAAVHSAALLESSIMTDAKREQPKTDEILKKKRKNAQQLELEKVIINIDSIPVVVLTTPAETFNKTNTSHAVASKSLPELTKKMKDNSKEQPGKKIKVIVRDTKDPKVLIPNSYVSKLKDISPSSKCSLEHPNTISSARFNIKGIDASTKSMYTSEPTKNLEKLKKLTKPIKEVISNKRTTFGRVEEFRTKDHKLETLYVKSKENTERNQINKNGELLGENLKTSMLTVNTVDNAKSAQKSKKSERLDTVSMGKMSNTATKSAEHHRRNKTDKNVCKSIRNTTKSTSRLQTPQATTPDENGITKLSTDKYRLKKGRSQFHDNLSKIDNKSVNIPIFLSKPKKKKRMRKSSDTLDIYFDTEISKELKKIDDENMKSKNVANPKHKNKTHEKKQKNDSRKSKYALENYTNHNSTVYMTFRKPKRVTSSESKKPSGLKIKMTNNGHRKRVKGKFSVTSSPYLVQSGKEPRPIEIEHPKELQKDHKNYSLEVIMEKKEKTDENYVEPTESKYEIATPPKNKKENILLTYFHKYLVDNQLEAEFSKYLQETKYFAKANMSNVLSCEEQNVKQASKDDPKSIDTNENVKPQIKGADIKEITNNEAKCTSLVKFEEPSRGITPIQSLDTPPLLEGFSSNQKAQIKEILKENYKEDKICKFNKNLWKYIKPDLDTLAEPQEGTPQSSEMKHLMKFWTPDNLDTKKEITNCAELNNATGNLKGREDSRKADLLKEKETKGISCRKTNSTPINHKEQQERKKPELLTRKERKKISYNDSIELNIGNKNPTEPEEPRNAKISNSEELKSANTEQKETRNAESLTGKEPEEISHSNLSKVNSANKTSKEQEEKKDELLTKKERKRKSYGSTNDLNSESTLRMNEVEPSKTEHSNFKQLKSASKCLIEQEKPRKVELLTGKETSATKSYKELREKRDELLTRNERKRKSYSNSNDLNSGNKCLTEEEYSNSKGLKISDKCITEQEEPRKAKSSTEKETKETLHSSKLNSATEVCKEQEERGAELLTRKKISYCSSDLINVNKCLMEQAEARKTECSNSKELENSDKCITKQEEFRKAKLITEKETKAKSLSNSSKLNIATKDFQEQEEREAELLTRNERKKISYSSSDLINVNECLMEQVEARKTECSDSKELKNSDKCITEQEKFKKAKLITEKEIMETPHSNSSKLNSATAVCQEQEERGAELLTRNERKKIYYSSSDFINANKCLMEQAETRKTEYSDSKELKNSDKSITEQEEPRKAKLITEKETEETTLSNSSKLNIATKDCKEQEERGAELLTRKERGKISCSNSNELNIGNKCLMEQVEARKTKYSNSKGLKNSDRSITEEEHSKAKLITWKETKETTLSNLSKINIATKDCKEQEEKGAELLTREETGKISCSNSNELNSGNKCLTEQVEARETEYSNSKGLKNSDRSITEQEEHSKAKLITWKETKETTLSNLRKINIATKDCQEQEEKGAELLTREENGKISCSNSNDLNSGNKCLTEQVAARKTEYSNSKGLKNSDRSITEQEEHSKAKLITEKETKETPQNNLSKLNSTTTVCKGQEERGAELLTRNERKKISYSNSIINANKCLMEPVEARKTECSNFKELNSTDKCLTEQKEPGRADLLIVTETMEASDGNPNKLNIATKNCKEQEKRKLGLLTKRTGLRRAELLAENETNDISYSKSGKLDSATKINEKEQEERKTELLPIERKKISCNDLNSGHKCLTHEMEPREVELLTKKEAEEISSTKSEANRKEAIKTKSLTTKEGKDMSNAESTIRISSITIEKTVPDRYQVVAETPKRVVWGCNKICLPLKKLSLEALKQPIDSATTLNMPISDNHRHIPNNMPDNLAKYKNMKITHMIVKRRPLRTLDEHFLPSVLRGKKRKDSREEPKDHDLDEEKAAMIALRYELLRKLHKQFCSIYGEDSEKTKGNLEKVTKHYDKVIKDVNNEPEALLPKVKPKARTVDWFKLDPKRKMDIRKEIEKEKEACNVNFSLHPSKELRNTTELFIEKLALQELSRNKKNKDKTDSEDTDNKGKPDKKDPQK